MKPAPRDANRTTDCAADERAWLAERTRQVRRLVAERGLDPNQPIPRTVVKALAAELDALPVEQGGRVA